MRALVELRTGTGPLPAAARRAVRVTLAACAGFYGFLYGLDQPVGATYALFTAVSLGALSQLPGSGRQRAALMVRLLPFACALVAVGTWLAVRTWAAVAGMLVIGFCLAFGSAAGPRQAGAGPGLQLLYILPSFPPYAPDGLGRRLAGTVIGVLLLVLAERYLLPDPPVARYRPLMLVAFCVGPVRGVGWAQAMFTLVIAMAFAQLAPVTWQLAEVRFLDVTVGSAIGIVCGLLAWPRGAHDELGRAVAELLRAAADHVRGVTAVPAHTSGPAAPPGAPAAPDPPPHRTEPAAAPPVYFAAMAWLDALASDLSLLAQDPAAPPVGRTV